MRWLLSASLLLPILAQAQTTATGFVFDDTNKNGVKDSGEKGIPNVKVSNQRTITKTDRNGAWKLPSDDDTIFFVVKPRNWMTPVTKEQLPRFFYIHKPAGSPAAMKFPGVAPTGPLPKSIDFPLYRRNEPNRFQAIFFGDTQPRDVKEVDYLTRDIIEPLVEEAKLKKYSFGVTLGDLVFDDLKVFDPYINAVALLGMPWYNVLGNHDVNYDGGSDKNSDETYHRHFGPNFYSFDHGPTHFIALDNVHVYTPAGAQRSTYKSLLGPEQLAWLKEDLAATPKNQLVVLMMHIPFDETEDKDEVFKLINERPYALSVAAHTHFQEHRFLNSPLLKTPHHHFVSVTTCGSWWQGRPDDRGVPIATGRDGAPNGFSVFTFDGSQYKIEFRAAGAPAEQQMNIYAPELLNRADVDKTDIVVNVYGGNEKSVVEMRFGATGEWRKMEKVLEPDPEFVKLVTRDQTLTAPFRPLPGAMNSPHLWKLKLPATTERGTVPVHIRTKDMFGQVYYATRGIRID